MLLAACGGSHAPLPAPGATSSPAATASVTATATPRPPTVTPTPHPLAKRPATATEAIAVLEPLLAAEDDVCPDTLISYWRVRCTSADVDGDGHGDAIYLVPLAPARGPAPHPAAVLVRRSAEGGIERFPRVGEADASIIGIAVFSVTDRTGDGQPEISYLVNSCGARGCASRLEIQGWDGTAWRDIGPADGGIDNVEGVSVLGEGASTVFTLEGGKLDAPGAGPPRGAAFHYGLHGSRYVLQATDWDEPEYLYHAIADADLLFEQQGAFAAAIDAYRAAIDNPDLKDWKAEVLPGRAAELPTGRGQLVGYALFRIAVATAALGQDAALAIDAVIAQSEEPIFAYAAEAFRRGYSDVGTIRAGCLEVTRYLTSANAPAYLAEVFDYGYANPRKSPTDICPL
ncbi:MAG: hypothetical protein M0R74_01405 [Dehalococcoidia bacterium]|nr:hypothetical protein [Dehalococcoidia bacterium]